ncbi:MAG: YveK family protein, partial [Candidatus Dormibacteraceae bacterium]
MDFHYYARIALKWSWLIILATAVAAGLTYRSASRVPKSYQATATLLVGRTLQTENPNPDDLRTSQTLAQNYAELVSSQPILQATSDALKLNVPWYALSPEVNATAVEGTDLIRIGVVDGNPRRAEAIANELARQLILESPTPKANDPQREFANQQMTTLQGQIKTTQGQIADLQKKADQETSATALQDERNQISILQQRVDGWQNTSAKLSDFYQGSHVNYLSVVDPATLPT